MVSLIQTATSSSNGGLITDFEFDDAHKFTEGLAAVYNAEKEKCAFINTDGEIVIDYKYPHVSAFNCGLAVFSTKDGKYGFIDENGETQLKAKYLYSNDFYNDGYTVVATDDKKYIVIDKKGKQIGDEYDKIGNAYCPAFCKNEDCSRIAANGSDYCGLD